MAEVTLPQLGETVTEGTITQWFKQVGDSVSADEALFEVSTDKVDTEVPSPVSGTLTEIRVQEGETVEVGTVIAVVGDGAGAAARPHRPKKRRPRMVRPKLLRPKPRPPRRRPAEGAPAEAEAPAEPRTGACCSGAGASAPQEPAPAEAASAPDTGFGQAALARRAAVGQRARPRPGTDHRHGPWRPHHP